jgi:hypothetical protein
VQPQKNKGVLLSSGDSGSATKILLKISNNGKAASQCNSISSPFINRVCQWMCNKNWCSSEAVACGTSDYIGLMFIE